MTKFFGKQAVEKYFKCGVPPSVPPDKQKYMPPGFEGPAKPDNDFPLSASITPTKGDPGTMTTIDVVAVGQPKALIVIVARFFDGKDHGMRAAKFTDLTGHATFEGPIPKDAPTGLAYIFISATTQAKKSALKSVKFIVTGPGCR